MSELRVEKMNRETTPNNTKQQETVQFFSCRFVSLRGLFFALQIIAFWSMWRWLALRVWASAEERWSFLALAAAVFFAFFWTQVKLVSDESNLDQANFTSLNCGFLSSIFFTLFYALSFAFAVPPLARAVLAMTAIGFTLSGWRFGKIFHFGLFGLLILSLPSVASLQFFLGYPLRVLVGKATARLLQLQGLDVWREGVCLHFGEKLVWIDAPCSGVKMLWFGLFLAAFLVCFYGLSNLKTLAVFATAFAIITLGNIFRASALFYIEAEIVNAPEFMHEAIGVFSFAFVALGIVCAAQFWRSVRSYDFRRENVTPEVVTPNGNRAVQRIFSIIFILGCVVAFSAPFLFLNEKTAKKEPQNFQGFPAAFENLPLQQLALSEREDFFLEDFPGKVGRFSDGKREIVVRYVTEATRKLHPAGDCFRAIGYATKPLPLKVDDEGKRWSCFSAVKADEELKVCERIYDNAGGEWTDVSAWYWSALNEAGGEWWAVTVAERK